MFLQEIERKKGNPLMNRPRADNTVGDGLIEIVTMLRDNKTSDAHRQTDTEEHWPTMNTMGVETARPQVTGSIELVEDQLVHQRRTGKEHSRHRPCQQWGGGTNGEPDIQDLPSHCGDEGQRHDAQHCQQLQVGDVGGLGEITSCI